MATRASTLQTYETMEAKRDRLLRSGAEIVCFGDSVFERASNGDRDTRPLRQMIPGALGPRRTEVVSGTAYHAGVFLAMMEALRDAGGRPRTIVLPLNLRSLSVQMWLDPEFRLDAQIAALRGLPAPPWDYDRYWNAPVAVDGRTMTVGELQAALGTPDDEERRRMIFQFHYMFDVDAGHPRLEELRASVRAGREMGAEVLVYAVPVNWMGGRSLVGESFCDRLARGVAVVRDSTAGARFEDLSTLLGDTAFFHPVYPAEHLNETGRKRLARVLRRLVVRSRG